MINVNRWSLYNTQKYLQHKIAFIVAPNSGKQNTYNIKYWLILKLYHLLKHSLQAVSNIHFPIYRCI